MLFSTAAPQFSLIFEQCLSGSKTGLQSLISELTVEPIRRQPDSDYVQLHADRLRELTAKRRIADLKSRIQRTNPVEQAVEYNRMFGELVALEAHARALRERALENQ